MQLRADPDFDEPACGFHPESGDPCAPARLTPLLVEPAVGDRIGRRRDWGIWLTACASLAGHLASLTVLLLWLPLSTSGMLDRPSEAISVTIVDSSVLESRTVSSETEAAAQQVAVAPEPGQTSAEQQEGETERPPELATKSPVSSEQSPPTPTLTEQSGVRASPVVDLKLGRSEAALSDEPALVRVDEAHPLSPESREETSSAEPERQHAADIELPQPDANQAERAPRPEEPRTVSAPNGREKDERTPTNTEKDHRQRPDDQGRDRPRSTARSGGASARASEGSAMSSASVAASQGDLANYAALVRARVAANKPPGTGVRGSAVVRFGVSGSGAVISAGIGKSSGDAGLDRAAVAAVRQASPFPPPPGGRSLSFAVPFSFQ
jgi:protein TonB